MDPYEFEEFVADLWEARGWNAQVTSDSADRGVDVIATQADPFSEKQVIQAKRYANTVSSPEIQQYASLRQQEVDVDAVVVVTTGEFSSQAKSVARDLNVKQVNIDDLYELVTSNGGREVYDDYFGDPDSMTRCAMFGAGPGRRGAPAGHTGPDAPVTTRWRFGISEIVWPSPAVVGGTVYFASDSLYAVDAVTGEKQWQFDTDGLVLSSPTVAGGTVYVGNNDHNLYAVDAVTGDEQWQFDTNGMVNSSPAVVDGTVYVVSWHTNLYAVGEEG
jgi:hypothetical protein